MENRSAGGLARSDGNHSEPKQQQEAAAYRVFTTKGLS